MCAHCAHTSRTSHIADPHSTETATAIAVAAAPAVLERRLPLGSHTLVDRRPGAAAAITPHVRVLVKAGTRTVDGVLFSPMRTLAPCPRCVFTTNGLAMGLTRAPASAPSCLGRPRPREPSVEDTLQVSSATSLSGRTGATVHLSIPSSPPHHLLRHLCKMP
ncbi:hypothetical protein C8Q80DRAFT_345388 [Daedaleopsis nitida]|nr:hypothetical protein C8Q80DRAFT_345388 [Daedaleopsis nitida]